MIAITIGGALYPPLEKFVGKHVVTEANASEMSATIIYVIASVSMAIPATSLSSSSSNILLLILFSFVLVEACVGLFMPVAGTLRSKYVPDSLHGGILNIFRLPLNAVVVGGTYASDIMEPANVFILVSGSFMAAALLQFTMVKSAAKKVEKKD